ncbi:MAG TPA: type II secretion system protein [Verrucomicrobiae bacterium]
MKPRCTNQSSHALTLVEVVVVVVVLCTIAALLLPILAKPKRHGGINCVNNVKEIAIASRVWAGDNNDKYPFEISVTNGGTMELNNGRNAWLNFLVMSNEISSPKYLICPQDTKDQPAATNFSWRLAGHVSYFVGLDAKNGNPQTILSGDDNFETSGVPIASSLLDVSSTTPIGWTTARHNHRGNILLADASVESFNNSGLTNWLHQTGPVTNRLAIP